MCKILAFTNAKKLNLSKCLNDFGNALLKTEQDGFGYAIQGSKGVFGEKTIAPKFRTRLGTKGVELPIVKKKYARFGTPSELTGPAIFHGRTSTNVINLVNTHPMQLEGWHLIHNGVVDDIGPNYEKYTENDSEDLLRRLIDGQADTNPMGVIERYLEGYYAFASIDPTGRLHIGRDNYATLYIAWSQVYETFIIATTESLLLKVNKILEAKVGPIDEIDEEVYSIFTGNELTHCQDFNSRGYTYRQASYATSSLGHSLPSGQAVPSTHGVSNPPAETTDVTEKIKNYEEVSEATWQRSVDEFIAEGARDQDVEESDYYKYRAELDSMDASYQVYNEDGKPIELYEFKRMDHVSQELCTITRADGTVVEPEDYGMRRLHHRRA